MVALTEIRLRFRVDHKAEVDEQVLNNAFLGINSDTAYDVNVDTKGMVRHICCIKSACTIYILIWP